VNDVVLLEEGKETTRNAFPSSNLSSVASFKKEQSDPADPLAAILSKHDSCPEFKIPSRVFSPGHDNGPENLTRSA